MTDHVIRYVITVPNKNGIGRTLMHSAQGRFTFPTEKEAEAWIEDYLRNNGATILDEIGRDVQVRPCKCYPEHFDPMEVYFDMPEIDAQEKTVEDIRKTLNWMDREKIVEIMESYGFQCYDSESTDELRDALQQNIEDGTIDPGILDA